MDLYDALSPLYMSSSLLGLSPYRLNREKNNCKYVMSRYGCYYSFLILTVFLICHHTLTQEQTSLVQVEYNVVTEIADKVHSYGISIVIVLIYVCNCYKREDVVNALNCIYSVDQNLLEYGCNLNNKFLKYFITVALPFIVILLSIAEYINCNLFISPLRDAYSPFCNCWCIVSIVIIMYEEFQFFIYFLLLRFRFKVINKFLRTENEKINSYKIHPATTRTCDKGMIVKLRSLHLKLCFSGKLLNEYFSIQILFLIALSFVGFTTNAYYSFDVITDNFGDIDSVASTSVWTISRFIELVVISVVCTITKNEVRKTGELLYQLDNKFQEDVAVELHLFAKQIMHCDFKITAFDFFDVDMSMFFGIIGSAATYLTILIQFEITAKGYNKYSNITTVT